MSRRQIVAANWKMNGTLAEAVRLAGGVRDALAGFDGADVVLCPPFTALPAVADVVRGTPLALAAQNVYWEPEGAFTGEISAGMLIDVGCRYVLVGHSERRSYFGETNSSVRRRVAAALDAKLQPIVCIGETLEQRESGATETVLGDQLREGLEGFCQGLAQIVIAYEPVWAIGTGVTASLDQAQSAHAFIRTIVAELCGPAISAGMRILYGGSVKPGNAGELCAQPDVDGGLVGGASLDVDSFAAIVRAAAGA